jgi:hypothetical protein
VEDVAEVGDQVDEISIRSAVLSFDAFVLAGPLADHVADVRLVGGEGLRRHDHHPRSSQPSRSMRRRAASRIASRGGRM